jgi:Zn-finger nucleic acid-binding protein
MVGATEGGIMAAQRSALNASLFVRASLLVTDGPWSGPSGAYNAAVDAGALKCPCCGATARIEAPQCPYCGAQLQTVSCPACFGLVFKGTRFCPHCDASLEAPAATPTSLHCPRCAVNLQAIRLNQTELSECPRCGGLWATQATVERICDDSDEQTAAIQIQLPPPVPADERVRYLMCPQCRQPMNRVNFAHFSGTILDVCNKHGYWFDRDELRRVIEFIQGGGLKQQRRKEIERLTQERKRLEAMSVLVRNMGAEPF